MTELLAGEAVTNANTSANMMRSGFYVCPICGKIIHSLGEASIHCHGVHLTPEEANPADEKHMLSVETRKEAVKIQPLFISYHNLITVFFQSTGVPSPIP